MKTTKKRLQELAAINNPFLKEGVDMNFPVKLTINMTAGKLLDMFKEAGSTIGSGAAPMDAQEFNRLVDAVQDDLNNWFAQEGVTWIEDGMNNDLYADFEDYE